MNMISLLHPSRAPLCWAAPRNVAGDNEHKILLNGLVGAAAPLAWCVADRRFTCSSPPTTSNIPVFGHPRSRPRTRHLKRGGLRPVCS